MRKLRRKLQAVAVPPVAAVVLRLLSKTWRVEHIDREHYDEWMQAEGRMGTLWHGRMMLALPAHSYTGLRILSSPSRDGKLAQDVYTRFGYKAIPGSTNKNPTKAVRNILQELHAGGGVVITPDGPRGPRHTMPEGVAWMARETGFPVMPCGFVCDRAWRLASWDRFTVPKPWARIALVYGEPVRVPADTADDELPQITAQIKERMMEAERKGFEHLGQEPDW